MEREEGKKELKDILDILKSISRKAFKKYVLKAVSSCVAAIMFGSLFFFSPNIQWVKIGLDVFLTMSIFGTCAFSLLAFQKRYEFKFSNLKEEDYDAILNYFLAVSLFHYRNNDTNVKFEGFNDIIELNSLIAYNKVIARKATREEIPESIQKKVELNDEIISEVLSMSFKLCVKHHIKDYHFSNFYNTPLNVKRKLLETLKVQQANFEKNNQKDYQKQKEKLAKFEQEALEEMKKASSANLAE
jgi:hypothetical protein